MSTSVAAAELTLAGRRALVTGAGSGMGRATALLLAARGAEVLVSDIDPETAEATADACRAGGGSAHALRIDVADHAEVAERLELATAEHGPVDVAVCVAGIGSLAAIADVSEQELDAVLAVSLGGTYAVARALLPGMRERGFGRLIGFSSLNAKTPPAQLAHYSAAKAALIGFTQAVALEVAPEVTVNCVCPGQVDTPILAVDLEHAQRSDPAVTLDDLRAEFAAYIPVGRMGQPDEIAQMVAFLASDRAAFVTGQAVNVSGGQEMG